MGEKVGEKLGEKVGKKTGEKVGDYLGEIHKLNLCQVPQHGPTFCLGNMIDFFYSFLAITPKQKECLLILTLCRLMIKFCYQY